MFFFFFCLFFFLGQNDHILHCLNIPQNSPHLEHRSHLAKNFIIYCHHECPPLGGALIKGSAFLLVTLIYFIVHSKTISTLSVDCAESRDIGHFCLPFFTKHSICGPSWQKVIKRILTFRTILKLLNKNFLQILFRTGSIAYLHIGVSEWHETHVTTFPWAPESLCKILGDEH